MGLRERSEQARQCICITRRVPLSCTTTPLVHIRAFVVGPGPMVAVPVALMLCHQGEAAREASISWESSSMADAVEKARWTTHPLGWLGVSGCGLRAAVSQRCRSAGQSALTWGSGEISRSGLSTLELWQRSYSNALDFS